MEGAKLQGLSSCYLPTFIFLFTILSIPTISGMKSCSQDHIVTLYQNSCKVYKRSHPADQRLPERPYPITLTTSQEAFNDDENEAEVIAMLTNGVKIMKEMSKANELVYRWGPPPPPSHPNSLSRQHFNRRRRSTAVGGTQIYVFTFPEEGTPEIPMEETLIWKKLLGSGSGRPGKIRRDSELVYKCCSVGCGPADFKDFC